MTGRLADFSQIILVFSLPLKLAQVLQAIVAGGTGNQRTAGPVMEQPVYIFTRNTCHRSKVGLRDLLSNHNASLPTSRPNASARRNSARAKRPLMERKLVAAKLSFVSRRRFASRVAR